MLTWELRQSDEEFFARELNSFVPEFLFDAHAHLYELSHTSIPRSLLEKGPHRVTLEEYRRQMEWLTPGRRVAGLFFGAGLNEQFYSASNQFVSQEVAKDAESRGQLIVSPRQDCQQIRDEGKKHGFVGLKVYHTFSTRQPTWESEIAEYFTEEHARAAHEGGWSITLHMVKERALADSGNQQRIRYYCEKYPNMKLILAHAARGFNPFHTIEGIHALKGLRNVWCDTSAVTEAGGFEAIIETLGHDRLLWGSDYPVSHLRGRCVAVGDQFLWLYEDTLNWETVGHRTIQLHFIGHESLRALKLAAVRLRLSDSQVENIFCNNARQMFGLGKV